MDQGAILKINQALEKEARLITETVLIIFGLVGLYAIFFGIIQRLPLGGPSSWAEFGDFFGGIVNPLVGIVTVILVVRTLRTTREEAAETRAQLEQQLLLQRQDRVLGDLRIRLDMTLGEWHRAMEVHCQPVFTGRTKHGFASSLSRQTRGTLLETDSLVSSLDAIVSMSSGEDRETAIDSWHRSFADCAPLLAEFAAYCDAYQTVSGTSILADYYRRRVVVASRVLAKVGLINGIVASRLEPAPLGTEDIG